MPDNYPEVVCSECGQGHYRFRSTRSIHCDNCGHEVDWRDFEEPVFYNPQWDRFLAVPERSREVIHAVHMATGIELTMWHTGGGCMALGSTLPNGRELIVTDGDANLPGRYDDELYAGIFDPEAPEDGESTAYEGFDLDDMVAHLSVLLSEED